MTNKKQLNDEELEKINGGGFIFFNHNLAAYSDYNVYVNKYAGKINTKYLFKKDNTHWVFGTLVNSYEKKSLFYTQRTHDIKVEDCQGFEITKDSDLSRIGSTWLNEYGTMEVNGDKYIIYIKN